MLTRKRLEQLEAKIGALRDATVAAPADSIQASELGTDSVETLKIKDLNVTTAKLNALAVTAAKIAASILDGAKVAVVADANVLGGIPVMYRILLASGADANVDVALTEKTRVTDVVVILKGAGTTGADVQVQNVTTAITDLLDVSAGADKAVFRPGTIDDASHEVAAAANLRVAYSSTGADFPGAEVYVTGMKVA